MFSSKTAAKAFLLIGLNLLISSPLFSAPQAITGYSIEWGGSSQTAYTFVFSGVITRDGRPCPNARVNLDIETSRDGVVTESAQAGADGRYEIAITIKGCPEQASNWKLQARTGSVVNGQAGEAEGRVILMDSEKTVVVNRTLPLVEA